MNTDNLINLIPTIIKNFPIDDSTIENISFLSEGEENWVFRMGGYPINCNVIV